MPLRSSPCTSRLRCSRSGWSRSDEHQAERGERFRALHEGEPFVIPNPWDAGSARVLEGLGFQALATTSSAFAFTLGRSDGEVTLDELAAHVTVLAAATDLPVSVDLENGYGPAPADAATAIARAAVAGAVGGSIEDWDPAGRLYELDHRGRARGRRGRHRAQPRLPVHAHRARGEPHPRQPRPRRHDRAPAGLRGGRRRRALRPGLASAEEIRAVCEAVGKPVNVLALRHLTFAEIAGAGAQRVSVGGSLAWAGVTAFAAAAEAIRDRGDFSVLGSGREAARLLGGG